MLSAACGSWSPTTITCATGVGCATPLSGSPMGKNPACAGSTWHTGWDHCYLPLLSRRRRKQQQQQNGWILKSLSHARGHQQHIRSQWGNRLHELAEVGHPMERLDSIMWTELPKGSANTQVETFTNLLSLQRKHVTSKTYKWKPHY